jgi:putative transposase
VTPAVKSLVLPVLANVFCEQAVRRESRRLGVVRRQGKVDAYALLVTVVLCLMVRGPTAISQLGHTVGRVTGKPLARSSFWDRFTPSFAQLMKWALDRLVTQSRPIERRPPGVLSGFRDVLAADATVMKVHDSLRPRWKGTRRNSARAAVKLHAWVRVLTGELVKYRLTREAFADCKAFGIDHQLRGVLMLFDRGYASPSLWRRIDSVDGYFLTRIPAGWNPTVIEENRRHRGRARKLSGLKLRDALCGLKRTVVDVQAEFSCRVRGYGGLPRRKVKASFRVVALLNDTTGEYSLYATNAPEELLAAKHVRSTYKLRWEAETFFKTAKSGSGMNELPSSKAHIVETLLYAGLLRAALAMRAKAGGAKTLIRRINPQQWMRWWNRQLDAALEHLLGVELALDLETLLTMLADPNRARIPTRYAFTDGELSA